MLPKPRKLAHIAFVFVVSGLLLSVLAPKIYSVSLGMWFLSVAVGIIALIKNGRLFPRIALTRSDDDAEKLDMIHFVEVYLSLIPGIFVIAYILFFKVFGG
jgi:hypothetical protein